MERKFAEGLEIRVLEEKDLNQFNELLSYVFQITESDIEESGYADKREMIKSKNVERPKKNANPRTFPEAK